MTNNINCKGAKVFLFLGVFILVLSTMTTSVTAQESSFDIPDGDLSALIDAFDAAQDATDTIINLASNGRYVLRHIDNRRDGKNGLPSIRGRVTINGNGATLARDTADDAPMIRLLHVAASGDLTLNNITLLNGTGMGRTPGDEGGSLFNRGTATLNDVTIADSYSELFGGSIRNLGVMTINDSVIIGSRSGLGGAIHNDGAMVIRNSTISGGLGELGGAAIHNRGQMMIENSTLSGNAAIGDGGAISNNADGTLIITNSTLSGNTATGRGGALSNMGDVTLQSVTINDNSADADGVVVSTAGRVTFVNTLIANSSGTNCIIGVNVEVNVSGNNLATDSSCPAFSETSFDALKLDLLAYNGSETATHALLPGSVAIDAAACIAPDDDESLTDQRGVERPQGTACDVGAYERVGAG